MEVNLPASKMKKLAEASALELLGMGLRRSLDTVIRDRSTVEQRWVEDLQQYLGQYDEDTASKLRAQKDRSSVFLNITRVMVNQSESQLADLLFPTDDKNWGISPTPNPEIASDLMDDTPADIDGAQLLDQETGKPVTKAQLAARARVIASERAEKMEREIDDQLVECDYSGEARRALHYATILGTGILAGPEATTSVNHRFQIGDSPDGEGRVAVIEVNTKQAPIARCVPPWDFYPDMSGPSMRDAEFIFERSFMTRKQVRQLLKRKGFVTDNIRKVLETEPSQTQSVASMGYVNDLRRLTGSDEKINDNRYEVWTYHGPISKDALIEAGVKLDPDDPLEEFDGVVVFCGDIVLKAALNPLEAEFWPYSVWCWQKDDFNIFGYGVPWLCLNEQRIVNTAWRMMLDNSAKSAGPQIIAKRSAIAPADGDPTVTPWKFWWADETISDVRSAFTVFTFPSLQQELSGILGLAKQFLTETAGLPPMVGQGQGQTPNTMGGMAMLMNSSNTDRRRQVRDWDDNVTKPLITRFYHWNMQYNPDESLKGDYEVQARGTSALLLREQQAINLMAILDKYAAHPVLGPVLKADATLRKVVQAMHIAPDEAVKTKEELAAESKLRAEQEQPQDPQIVVEQMRSEQIAMRADFQRQMEEFRTQTEATEREADRQLRRDLARLEVSKQDRLLQMQALQLAQTKDINYQKILADLKKQRWKLNLDSTQFDREMDLVREKGVRSNYGLQDDA